ncbi:MAG: heavy metal sensor histidine kinase [Planctomycetes bacterium]|nr:heavy metal sensor histidine kinase [Planctomycetota bacterium]
MSLFRPRSVRMRLALWHTLALALVLLVYAGAVYAFVRASFLSELDRKLHEDFEYTGARLAPTADGGVRWRGDEDAEEHGPLWLEVRAAGGTLLYRAGAAAPDLAEDAQARRGPESLHLADGRAVRWMSRPFLLAGRPLVIRAARSEEAARAELARLLAVLALGIPLAVLAAGAGGALLAGRALEPVAEITARAGAITAERLSERLPVDNPHDELGRLAAAFNATFERLERSFASLRSFTADAAHELRTPLTALKSVGEVALRAPREGATYREVIGSMLEEADGLARLVSDLLLLARGDAEELKLERTRVNLGRLARAAASRLEALAEEKQQSLALELDDALSVDADETVLRHALLNLIDNAIQHSPAGARIAVRALHTPAGPALEVSDSGPGIAPEHRARVFERFYRVDPARSREHGGAGLGLAIARWAVQAHGGRIELESEVGRGSTFRIVLAGGENGTQERPT